MKRLRVLPLSLLPLLAACPINPAHTCTLEARASVSVLVRDAASGAGIAIGATGLLRDGAYVDSLIAFTAESMAPKVTFERPGTYEVTIEKPGYVTATRSGIVVRAGECHVEGELVEIRMQRN